MTKKKYVIGIDEVGRGPLAGPVLVAAVAVPVGLRPRCGKFPLRDSKRLSAIQRGHWFEFIKNHPKIDFAVARLQPRSVDRLNIAKAANRAATRALKRLNKAGAPVYLDGGLFLEKLPAVKAKTVVRGDGKINAVKLASIVAKVTRDKYMVKLHKKLPEYGFDEHKGYGTKKHKRAIGRHGLSDFHRKSFCKFV